MRTVTLYTYEDLSTEAKTKAIEEVREEMEENETQSAYDWAIDDCSLFEPPHAEMAALFGEDYYERNGNEFVFKNKRKGIQYHDYFERAQIEDALEVTNSTMFKTWLGIPERFHRIEVKIFDYGESTTIEMDNPYVTDNPIHPVIENIIENATEKFEAHVSSIGARITESIKEYFSDENVEMRMEDSGYEFDESGKIVNI